MPNENESAEAGIEAPASAVEPTTEPATPTAKRVAGKKTGKGQKGYTGPKPRRLEHDRTFDTYVKKVCINVARGMSEAGAVSAAGGKPRTHRKWKQRGIEARDRQDRGETLSREDKLYVEYVERVEHATGPGESALLRDMREAMKAADPGDRLKAIQWLLTHSPQYRDSYAQATHQKVEVSGPEGKPVQTQQVGPVIMIPPEAKEE